MIVKSDLSHKKVSIWVFIILNIVACYLVYAPTLHIPFYHHDIYKFSNGGLGVSCEKEAGYAYLYDLGRPISAWLDCANFKVANTVDNIIYARLACVFLIGLTMGIVAFWLYSVAFSFWIAFLISGSIFYLPVLQTTMIMAASNLILAILSAFLANLSVKKGAYFQLSNRFLGFSLFALGFLLLLGSLLTYPALSGFFLFPTLMTLLFSPLNRWREIKFKVIGRDVLVFCIGCLIYYFLVKHIQQVRNVNVAALMPGYRLHLNFNIIDRIYALLTIFPKFWNIFSGTKQAILGYLILISGLLAAFSNFSYKESTSTAKQSLIQAMLATIGLLLLGSVVFIVMPESWAAYRIIFVFQAMSLAILVWCVYQICFLYQLKESTFIFLLCVIFGAGAILANYIVTKSALNDNLELNFMTAEISHEIKESKTKISRIHVIVPSVANFTELPAVDDIFNSTSANSGDITNMVNTVLLRIAEPNSFQLTNCMFTLSDEEHHFQDEKKCIKAAPRGNVVVTYSWPNKPIFYTPNTITIKLDTLTPLVQHPKWDLKKMKFGS